MFVCDGLMEDRKSSRRRWRGAGVRRRQWKWRKSWGEFLGLEWKRVERSERRTGEGIEREGKLGEGIRVSVSDYSEIQFFYFIIIFFKKSVLDSCRVRVSGKILKYWKLHFACRTWIFACPCPTRDTPVQCRVRVSQLLGTYSRRLKYEKVCYQQIIYKCWIILK